ncbi:MAG: tRNA (adenosine(37)-N6)-threonylcarbamoyltransferase complex ATPase subunit type 1 TsaE [bacterium]|nr:tRNA (adenosine(37)-N6)-threonylcarbamoyltransferase complex ATPase subunit type 1 TsaE [bacterium]
MTKRFHEKGRLPSAERIFCLSGELGSGKTTFVQGFAKGLGISGRLLSPTYIIVRRYSIPQSSFALFHGDFYRIETPREGETLGLPDIFSDPSAIVVLEWPERIAEALPKSRTHVYFSVDSDEKRTIRIEKF